MCPGCMTTAALQELGPNPLDALRAAFGRALPGPASAQPSTAAEATKGSAHKGAKDAE